MRIEPERGGGGSEKGSTHLEASCGQEPTHVRSEASQA